MVPVQYTIFRKAKCLKIMQLILSSLTPMSLSKISVTIVGGLAAMVLTSPQMMISLKIIIWSQVGDRVSQMTRVSAALLPMITRANASEKNKTKTVTVDNHSLKR